MQAPKRDSDDMQSPMAFEEIYQEYGGKILNLAYRMTGREDIARDLTQDVFIKVFEKRQDFRGDSQIYTWIYRVATNHILNYLKKENRRKWFSLLDKSIEDVLTEKQVDAAYWNNARPATPDRKLEKKEQENIVRQQIEKLPVKYRVPFLLHRYEGISYQEIATILDLSLSAVEARIHRAKKMLVEKLTPLAESL